MNAPAVEADCDGLLLYPCWYGSPFAELRLAFELEAGIPWPYDDADVDVDASKSAILPLAPVSFAVPGLLCDAVGVAPGNKQQSAYSATSETSKTDANL